jgi:hypothetical protein
MKMSHAIVIAAALLAVAIIASSAWTQPYSTPLMTGIVVSTCTQATSPAAGTQWTYAAGTQAPITLLATGQICVNQ